MTRAQIQLLIRKYQIDVADTYRPEGIRIYNELARRLNEKGIVSPAMPNSLYPVFDARSYPGASDQLFQFADYLDTVARMLPP